MKKMRMAASILEIIVGVTLLVCSFVNLVNEFWSSFGVAMIVVGTLFLLRNIKYHRNEKYREEVDIQNNDERNKYISLKAWSWAGYLFVFIAAIATIIFRLINQEALMLLSSSSVCLVMLIYWISYIVLQKKY